ncbi:MAG: hypothetical protein JXA50_02760 [Deltaproteobacteria bacterium]|nr:hypothetical protein [Deltaproteobacteria bacterium]
MRYEHTQKGKLHLILYFVALYLFISSVFIRHDPFGAMVLFCGALLILVFGFSLQTFTVRDEGDFLRIFSGPLPLFRKKIQYSEIEDVKINKSNILDGWGLHYGIGRGWIINIWGFDCIALKIGKKKFRIGTDDKEALFDFLKRKLEKDST